MVLVESAMVAAVVAAAEKIKAARAAVAVAAWACLEQAAMAPPVQVG